jgi:hypothetical protein
VTRVYPGPTSLTALGSVGELDLLTHFDGELVVPEAVEREVTTEPARTGLETFLEERDVGRRVPEEAVDPATGVLGVAPDTHEAAMLGGVLAAAEGAGSGREDGPAVAVVSEDRRLRNLTEGFGGVVTSAFGVVVRAAIEDKYFSRSRAKRVVRRIDDRGLGMTGTIRAQVVGDLRE